MQSGNTRSSLKTVLLVVAALVIGAGGMYIYNERNKESFSVKLPGGNEIKIEKSN
ncbi:MAG: hypothetical protein KDJ90_18745 [Nitratireductor sp.]|nr:hypothetical protein [Nitratireductor sp.]